MRARRGTIRGWAAVLLAAVAALAPADAAGATIRISGTGGAVMTFRDLGKAFARIRPGVEFVVLPNVGSSGGIRAVLAGRLDIGLSARPLNDDERGRGIVARAYAKTPFVFGVNEGVKIRRLTLSEVADVFAGRKSRWDDGRRIRLVMRPPTDTDVGVLRSMSPQMKEAVAEGLRREGMLVAMTEQDAADAIERTPGALGAVSLSLVLSERRAIRVVALDGVVPSVRALADGRYPHSKTFYMVTKRDAPPAVRAFLDFVRSPAGAAILDRNGQAAVR